MSKNNIFHWYNHYWTIGISLLGYIILALWMPLLSNLTESKGVREFTPSLLSGLLYGLLFAVLYGLYWQLYSMVRNGRWVPRLATLLLITGLFVLPLLFTYPYNANDLFRYATRGRITAVYHGNPFEQPPQAYPHDPFTPLAGEWMNATTPYGPIWELTAAGFAAVTPRNPVANLIALKLFSAVLHLLMGILIWRLLAASPSQQRNRTLMWLLNPALLLTFVADGHNDSLMLFWLIWGWAILRDDKRRGRLTWKVVVGFLVMVLSPLTKAIGLAVLPFFFLHIIKRLNTFKQRLLFILYSGVGSFILLIGTFLPFGSPLTLAQRLVNEAGDGASFSLGTLYLVYVRDILQQPITRELMDRISLLTFLFLGLTALFLSGLTWFFNRSPLRASADIFFAYILQALNFRLWYTAWSFPFLLLDYRTQGWGLGDVYRIHIGLWFLLLSQLSVVIYGHLWAYVLGVNDFYSHLLGVPFTLILPFILGRWTAYRARTI